MHKEIKPWVLVSYSFSGQFPTGPGYPNIPKSFRSKRSGSICINHVTTDLLVLGMWRGSVSRVGNTFSDSFTNERWTKWFQYCLLSGRGQINRSPEMDITVTFKVEHHGNKFRNRENYAVRLIWNVLTIMQVWMKIAWLCCISERALTWKW